MKKNIENLKMEINMIQTVEEPEEDIGMTMS